MEKIMRINQYLAHCGLCSRRKAEQLVLEGKITLNGEVVRNLSTEISDKDIVEYDRKKVVLENTFVYYMLNKPKGYLCTASDDRNRPTVLNIVKDTNRIYPVGRLDFNTEGLLLLTNDGEWANKVIHPRSNIEKTYEVLLKTKPTSFQIGVIQSGVIIDGVMVKPTRLTKVTNSNGLFRLEVSVMEGKNREIRKLFDNAKCKIFALKRISIGKLQLGDLDTKKYRKLTKQELNLIFK